MIDPQLKMMSLVTIMTLTNQPKKKNLSMKMNSTQMEKKVLKIGTMKMMKISLMSKKKK